MAAMHRQNTDAPNGSRATLGATENCSMKITQDVRDYAAEHGVDVEAAIPEGMREKSRQFEALGGQIYHESLPDEA